MSSKKLPLCQICSDPDKSGQACRKIGSANPSNVGINVVTLGCSKNIVDSEVLMGQLRANHFSVEHKDKDTDADASVLIVNTCGFIETAKRQSIETIFNAIRTKEKGFVKKVFVTGCLSERYKDALQKEIPQVDAWFGTRDLHLLLKTLGADYPDSERVCSEQSYPHKVTDSVIFRNGVHHSADKTKFNAGRSATLGGVLLRTPSEDLKYQNFSQTHSESAYKHELVGERWLTTPSHYAYLKISEGCSRSCSFCAIPLMRGKHISVPMEKILKQAKELIKNGTKEIILLAQDLTYYGLDIFKKQKLAELLKKLSALDGAEWIRLHYAYPSGFPLEILNVMRERNNICKYLDIPLQHISDKILKSMRRGITKEKTIKLIDEIRSRVPGIAIRTTLLCGYPGETQREHEEMLEWVEETKFERLGVFAYSHEDGTPAFALKDNILQKEKQRRADAVMKLQQKISFELNKKMIGKTFRVLFDKKEEDYFIGRTEYDSPDVDNTVLVNVSPLSKGAQGDCFFRISDFAEVKITGAKEYDLIGTIIN